MSTQAIVNDWNSSVAQDVPERISLTSISSAVSGSILREKNQQKVSPVIQNESIDVLPSGVVSNNLLLTLESTVKANLTHTKQKKALRNESYIKEDNDRLNRVHFHLKNIKTNITYLDVFTSIATMFPLIQIKTRDDVTNIRYLCVAGNILFFCTHPCKI